MSRVEIKFFQFFFNFSCFPSNLDGEKERRIKDSTS